LASTHDTAPTLRILEAVGEVTCLLVVTQASQPGDMLILSSSRATALQVMMLGEVILPAGERQQLADWLGIHRGLITRPHDWRPRPGDDDA
jgi:hypothetical protein